MGAREYMRMKLLEEMYDKMSPEEKRTFVTLTMQDKSREEILAALRDQKKDIGEIRDRVSEHTWLRDFSSNIAGNAIWDGFVYFCFTIVEKVS